MLRWIFRDFGVTTMEPQTDIQAVYLYSSGGAFPTEALRNAQATPEAIIAVQSMLVKNPKDRVTTTAALRSPWLVNSGYSSAWYINRCRQGYVEIVKLLLDHGADVKAFPGTAGLSALQEASEGPHIDVFLLLVENGAYATRKLLNQVIHRAKWPDMYNSSW